MSNNKIVNSSEGIKLFYSDKEISRLKVSTLDSYESLEISGNVKIGNELFITGSNSHLVVSSSISASNYVAGNLDSDLAAIRPFQDDYFNLGNSSYRWDDIWASNTSINSTSDMRKKDSIEKLSHGVRLINELNPVEYKWKDYTITTENGTVIRKEFNRKHFGLLAQDLKNTLDKNKISTKDFGPYVYDAESDSYAIRYGEFIPILIKSVQELSKENNSLKQRIEDLENLMNLILK